MEIPEKNSQDYDERQQLDRGKAYRLAFIVLVIYETAYALLSQFMDEKLEVLTGSSNFELVFTGVSLSILVFVTYAICRDARVRLCDYMDAHLYLWTYAAVIYIALFVWNIVRGRTVSLRDIWALDVIVPLIALYIRRWRLKREEETECEPCERDRSCAGHCVDPDRRGHCRSTAVWPVAAGP